MTARHRDSCDRARELISRSQDCELPQLQQSLVQAHVGQCASCAAFEAEVAWITTSLRQAPFEENHRVVTLPRRRRPLRLRVAVQAASIALVAVGVGSVVLSGGPVIDHTGEEALLAASLSDELATDSLRALRGDAVRNGDIPVLPGSGSDPLGEAKPVLPAVPG